jgi:hypothetical protein
MNLFLDFNADVVSLAWARKLGSKFGAGLTLSRINSNTSINGLLAPEGIFTRRGIEKSFNDPGAGWQNDFYSSMNGDFAGGAWGMKTGFAYQPNDRFCLNLLMNYPGNMTLNGEMEIIQYFYPALNLNADEAAGEEIFNLDNIQNFAQPTETVLADNQPSNQLTINLPRSIALGVAYRGISFTLSAYSGELSYAYDLARDGNWVTYSRGLKPKFGFLLGFDIKYLQLSLGAIAVDEVVSGYLDSENKPIEPMSGIYIPRFNLSTGFRVAQNWRTEVLLLSSPDLLGSVLKVGATYSFE